LELPVVREPADARVDLGHVGDHAVDQLLTEGVVFARVLEVLEEQAQVLHEVGGGVEAPSVEILHGGGATVLALGELGFAHAGKSFFSAAISSAARANSAPRLMAPVQRASAWARVSATITPLMTGIRELRATVCRAADTLAPTISWWLVSPPMSTPRA